MSQIGNIDSVPPPYLRQGFDGEGVGEFCNVRMGDTGHGAGCVASSLQLKLSASYRKALNALGLRLNDSCRHDEVIGSFDNG